MAPGDRVASGAALLSVYPVTGLELRARVPNRYQDEISIALEEGVPLRARVMDQDIVLALERLAGESDPAGTEAILSVATTNGSIRPGRMLSVLLELPPAEKTLAVPYSALYGNDTLYLANDDDRLERAGVAVLGETQMPSGERWLLVKGTGLAPGQRVVTTHLPNAVQGLLMDAGAMVGAAQKEPDT